MTAKANTFEGGTDTTSVTTANSGGASGDAFTTANVSGGTTTFRTYQASGAIKGSLSMHVVAPDTANSLNVGWDAVFTGVPGTGITSRFYIKFLADTTASGASYHQVRTSASGMGGVVMNTGLSLRALYAAAGNTVTGSAFTVSLNTVYRVEINIDPGTAADGRVKYALYLGDDTASPLVNVNVSGLTISSGANLTSARWGKTGAPGTADYIIDAMASNDTSGQTFIGPVAANQSPTVSVGSPLTTALGSGSSMTATASDPDGTIATYAWTQLTGPTVTLSGSTTATATFTGPSAGHYSFRCTVTDNLGATAQADKVVYVTSSVSRPETLTSNTGSWTAVGAGSLPAAINDNSNATYIQSPTSPVSSAACRFLMTPLQAGSSTISYTHDQSASTPQLNTTFTLLQGPGMTTIAQWVEAPTTTITTTSHTLTSGQQTALTDGNNLYLDIATVLA